MVPPRFRMIDEVSAAHAAVRTRFISPRRGAPALELVESSTDGVRRPPVLFVHGAFGGAWMWREVFFPHFIAAGFPVAAFSLRGHGASHGREVLRRAALADFVEDLRAALAEMPAPPIVIAHSLGGLIAQLLIGRVKMKALVLMASLPPDGMFFVTPRLALTDTAIFIEAFLSSITGSRVPLQAAAHQVLFSEGLPRDRVHRYASLMVPESPRALAEAHAPGVILPARHFDLPTFVIGGDNDRLVWRASTWRTALYHGAEHETAVGLGHFMQLDIGADGMAKRVIAWLEERLRF